MSLFNMTRRCDLGFWIGMTMDFVSSGYQPPTPMNIFCTHEETRAHVCVQFYAHTHTHIYRDRGYPRVAHS
jgi:hypothetical protein